ncbi:MAG TPA: PfkB family carbohydrate kinase [Anaerolineae bacterium]|nr:PfkB family carbohydrate kinase [Anaerolineae bacterium]
MSIVVIGSLAFDDVVTQHGAIRNAIGGSALYFATAASLFAPVSIVGVVGEDFPLTELEFLRLRKVELDGIQVIKGGKTFRWTGEYELDMNKRKTTRLELNVFKDFKPLLPESCKSAKYVFLGNIDPDIQLDVLEQVESPGFSAADTIECYLEDKPDTFREVLERINLLFINDSEACLFTGKNSIISAARVLLECGPEYVIIKKGEHGSFLVSRDMFFTIPAYPVENIVDPTGAGDSFAGGAMGYCARVDSWDSLTLKKAVVYGSLVASFLVESFSLQGIKNLTLDEIEERLKIFRSMTSY